MAQPSVDAAFGTNTGDIPTVQAAVPIWAKTASPLYQPFEAELDARLRAHQHSWRALPAG